MAANPAISDEEKERYRKDAMKLINQIVESAELVEIDKNEFNMDI
jgi:hypothetical protein